MYFRIWKFEDSLEIVIIYSCFDKPGYLDLKLISLLAGPFNTSNLICHLLKMRALDSIAKKRAIPTVVLFEIGWVVYTGGFGSSICISDSLECTICEVL